MAALVLLSLAACRDNGNNMRNTQRYKPLAASDVFDDGASARPPVPGTVSRDDWTDDPAYHTGMVDGQLVAHAPVKPTPQLLQRGRDRFNIYCTPCHGYAGDGDGMIVQRGYTPPPSFHTDRLRQMPDGYLFNVITHGLGRMPSHAAQVPVADRWAIIAYIRALQLSRHATASQLPADVRQQLEDTP